MCSGLRPCAHTPSATLLPPRGQYAPQLRLFRPIALALHTGSSTPYSACAPYGLYAGYVLGLAPLRAYAVGYAIAPKVAIRSAATAIPPYSACAPYGLHTPSPLCGRSNAAPATPWLYSTTPSPHHFTSCQYPFSGFFDAQRYSSFINQQAGSHLPHFLHSFRPSIQSSMRKLHSLHPFPSPNRHPFDSQVCPSKHFLPHVRQFSIVDKSVAHFVPSPSQSAYLGAQNTILHTPSTHATSVACLSSLRRARKPTVFRPWEECSLIPA